MKMRLAVSDWVLGRTREGEMVYGFVEAADSAQGVVTLYVVKSDNEERVGRTADVLAFTAKKIPEAELKGSRHVDDLIDLALATWDEVWFRELTEELEASARAKKLPEGGKALPIVPVNRLSQYLQ